MKHLLTVLAILFPVVASAQSNPAPSFSRQRNLADVLSTSMARANLGVASPADRTPNNNDDTAHGYTVGDLWRTRDNRMYQAIRVSPAGQAAWQRLIVGNALPGSIVSALAFACGDKLANPAYTGASVQIARTDTGATSDVPFLPGGSEDYATADNNLGGSQGLVTKCYDQISTNDAVAPAQGPLLALPIGTPGTGYTNGSSVVFTGGTCSIAPAATIVVTGGAITGTTITTAGSCTVAPAPTVTGGTGGKIGALVGARPIFPGTPYIGNSRGILYDNTVSNNGTAYNYVEPGAAKNKIWNYLTIPSGLALSTQSVSVVSMTSFGHSLFNSPVIELSGSVPLSLGKSSSANGAITLQGVGFSVRSTTPQFVPPLNPTVIGYSSGANVSIFGSDRFSRTYAGTLPSGTTAGGIIGGGTQLLDSAGFPDYGYNIQGDVLIFNRALTAAEYQTVAAWLYQQYDVYPQLRNFVINDGDSITEGALQTNLMSWARLEMETYKDRAMVFNTAISGSTFSAQNSVIAANCNILAEPHAFALHHMAAGTNDIGSSLLSAIQIETNEATYYASLNACAIKPNVEVLQTILPRGLFVSTPAYETIRLAVNAYNIANAGTLGFVVNDITQDPTMGLTASTSNVTLYKDGTHPAYPLGGAYLGSWNRAFIDKYLP